MLVFRNKKFLIGYKLFFALLGFSALITEIATLAERGVFNLVNFLSFFTVESNILVIVTLLLSALAVTAGKNDKLDTLRSAVTVYILIVGIGFSFLLSGLENVALTAVPWDNTVLHYIIPTAMSADLLIDRPKQKISFKKGLVWLLFPIAYGGYSLMRGGIVGWYPYPFLNPANNGYGSIAVTIGGLVLLGLILVFVVTKISDLGQRHNSKS